MLKGDNVEDSHSPTKQGARIIRYENEKSGLGDPLRHVMYTPVLENINSIGLLEHQKRS